MNKIEYFHQNFKIGNITLVADKDTLMFLNISLNKDDIMLEWLKQNFNSVRYGKNSIIQNTLSQLEEYFNGERATFKVLYHLKGTEFQKKVWNSICNIPYGCTSTYGKIAEDIGNKNAARAVGNALNKNPIGIIIPCHRVIGADKNMCGFAAGIKKKKQLLELERLYVSKGAK